MFAISPKQTCPNEISQRGKPSAPGVAVADLKSLAYSVKNREIEFYSHMDDWWSPNGSQSQLHKFNKVRVDFIRRIIMNDIKPSETSEQLFSNFKVLDIGSGAGILSEGLGRLGMGSVLGIDPTPKCIDLAEEHLS